MGGKNDPSDDTTGILTTAYPEYAKLDEIIRPAPSLAINFVDESANTIDDGYFAIDESTSDWQNSPTGRHNRAAPFGFAEGHSEFWKWLVLNGEQDLNAPTIVRGLSSLPDLKRVQNAVFLPSHRTPDHRRLHGRFFACPARTCELDGGGTQDKTTVWRCPGLRDRASILQPVSAMN